MAKKLDTTYKSARFGNCTYALILDKRHPKKDKNTFPVVMRYTIDILLGKRRFNWQVQLSRNV